MTRIPNKNLAGQIVTKIVTHTTQKEPADPHF